MQRYEAIENGIERKDVKALRAAIGSIIYTSRDFSSGEFDEAVKYVESKGIKLKDDALTGDPLISSRKSTFTDDDFADAIFELKENFCDERIQDVKRIGKALYSRQPQTKPDLPKSRQTDQAADTGNLPNGQSRQSGNSLAIIVGLAAVVILAVIILLVMK